MLPMVIPDAKDSMRDVILEFSNGSYNCVACILSGLDNTILADIIEVKDHLDMHMLEGHEIDNKTLDAVDELVEQFVMRGGLDADFVNAKLC